VTDQEPQANRVLARLLAQRYEQALRDADSVAAEEAIEVALQAGFDGAAICSRVIAPAMRWIGDLWERDSISVADEHLATAITHHLLGRLQASLFPPPPRTEAATALLACAEGEQHTLGLSMVADVLRSRGWRVLELGASVPAEALVAAIDRHSPHLVGFSATMSWSIPSLAHALERIAEARPRARVILGGNGIPGRLRETHPWASEVEEAVHLVDPASIVAG
jgi:methanogenic corrinoid protein MtbC1